MRFRGYALAALVLAPAALVALGLWLDRVYEEAERNYRKEQHDQ